MSLIIGNWKMNPGTLTESKKLLEELEKAVSKFSQTQVVICPPIVFLQTLVSRNKKGKISLGAQNAAYDDLAEHTGGVSSLSLADIGVKYVILGHSDRRCAGESNEDVNRKVLTALKNGLRPVICFGEKNRDGDYLGEVEEQLRTALRGVTQEDGYRVVVAYEPVWAIGPKALREATPDDLKEILKLVWCTLGKCFPGGADMAIPVLYGGSANAKNAHLYLGSGMTRLADGLLVGRASRDAENFAAIVKVAETLSLMK